MKECKYKKMPPCYSGKKFRIHEELEKIKAWDETHDKVYELNKQMCDIDKHLSEAGYFRMICDGQIETRKKLIDMEEKKTKKMTKASAFGYLTYKKVACYNRKEVDIQKKLFEIGFMWCDGTSVEVVGLFDFLLIDDGTFQFTDNVSHFRKHAYEEISADDILSIEIVEENCLDKDCAMSHAMEIMRWLREKKSPHTTMIIDGNHAELLEGVKSVVWKEDMK